MSEPSLFRHYQIVQDADGNNVELARNAEQVAVLAFDTKRLEYVHCHVLLNPLTSRAAFDDICQKLQQRGHPALARMIDFGEDEGNPFYITSNIDGEPLRTYLGRLTDLPCWLAVMIASRSLETAMALAECGDAMTDAPLDSLRVVQTGPQTVQVLAGDFRVLDSTGGKKRVLKAGFDKQAKFLRSFLVEQSGGNVTLADHPVAAADFMELMGACLGSAGMAVMSAMRDLRATLLKLAPEHLSGEIPTAQKPRALLAPLLASYQEVARGVVNLVRIQSQRLDMANPYSMRGTLTKAGRPVLIEQVPPARVSCPQVLVMDNNALRITKKREFSALIKVALVNEAEGITCVAEEVAEGISLADLLKERRCIDVQEAYLVLAALDSALSQLDASTLKASKVRIDDIFLLTGFSRDDPRGAKLLTTKLNEWPAFNMVVRAHPTLASMAGRGTDPAVLLPPAADPGPTPWHGAWMAAMGKFLVGFVSPLGIQAEPDGSARERETLARLLDEEIDKLGQARPATRSDFLSRFARVIQHHDLVKPPAETQAAGVVETIAPKPRSRTVSVSRTKQPAAVRDAPVMPLTSGSVSTSGEAGTIGFAELLFRSGGGEPAPPDAPDWARDATGAPPTLPEHLIPDDAVPFWLKAAVFIGGTMILGAILAHFSGHALWQRKAELGNRPAAQTASPLPPSAASAVSTPLPPASTQPAPAVPKAIPVPEEDIPLAPPPEKPGEGLRLSLPPGAGGLREQLSREPPK